MTIRNALQTVGRSLHLFDLTNDLGVPVVAATSANDRGRAIYLGAAADSCLLRAAHRAASELAQFWHWDTSQKRLAASRATWLEHGGYSTENFLDPTNCPVVEFQTPAVEHFRLPELVMRLQKHGLHPYAVDLTRPTLGIPVVRTIVPGLRHCGRRFGAGRLYDVPVHLGWLEKPTPEALLNPHLVPL